ncbi:cadherin-99C-like [Saccoglossus kowalevskii]
MANSIEPCELCDYNTNSPTVTDSYEQEAIGTTIYNIPVEGGVGSEIELSLSVEDGHDDKFYLDIKNITWAVVYNMEEENCLDEFSIEVTCTVISNSRRNVLPVLLGIDNINEFPPTLEKSPYKVDISEVRNISEFIK